MESEEKHCEYEEGSYSAYSEEGFCGQPGGRFTIITVYDDTGRRWTTESLEQYHHPDKAGNGIHFTKDGKPLTFDFYRNDSEQRLEYFAKQNKHETNKPRRTNDN